jgi:hypothetical protein
MSERKAACEQIGVLAWAQRDLDVIGEMVVIRVTEDEQPLLVRWSPFVVALRARATRSANALPAWSAGHTR